MKILYLTMDGFDTAGPNNQMAMVMIREFLVKGHHVHLIQSRRKKEFAEIPLMLDGKTNLTVETVDRKIIDKTNFIIRYLDEVKWAFQSFSRWRKVKNVDVVFLQSCPSAVFQLILLKLFCRKPVLFNIYDVWPGHAMDLGVIRNKFLYNILRVIQRIAYSLCARISVLSEDMQEKIEQQGVTKDKIVIIPAWYDDRAAMQIPDEKNRFLQKYNIEKRNHFIVQFAGTIGYVFDYKIVLDTAELLLEKKDIRFQMIGDGAFKETFVKEAEQRGLVNIDFYPLQPVEIVPDVYSACDIAMIPLRKGVIGNGVPSKAPLLMACHKVIVNSVEKDSHYYKLFNENKLGISVPLGDARGLADAIVYLHENPEAISKMADNAQDYSRQNYRASFCTDKLMDAFKSMLKA